MTYDSVIQTVVLFGGYDGTNYPGDTWRSLEVEAGV